MITVSGLHPAGLGEAMLRKQCRVTFGRGSGPGGQHRNKVETEARITHLPTGISAAAGERRSQTENQRVAVRRLRLKLAREVRTQPAGNGASALWARRRQGNKMPVNPKNRDYPALLAESLDVVVARGYDVGGAAGDLAVTMSQLARLIRHDHRAFALVNEGRTARGLPPLK